MDNLIKEINSIHDSTDLKILRTAINDRITVLGSVVKYSLRRGDLVNIQTRNKLETGTIDKVNRTRAVVNINGKLWNVPFSMMTKIEKGEVNE